MTTDPAPRRRPDRPHRSSPNGLPAGLALTTVIAVAATTLPAAHGAALGAVPPRPDLTTTSVLAETATAAEGGSFVVSHVLRTTTAAASGASTTRFYLSLDPAVSQAERTASRTHPRSSWSDVRLVGEQAQPALGGSASSPALRTTVVVPVGTAAGSYTVLACADDLGGVAETLEQNNCAAADAAVRVAEAPGSLDLETYSQTYPWPASEDMSVAMMQAMCRVVRPARALTTAQALAGVRAHLTRTAGAGALEMVAASPLAATASGAQGLAAEGVLQHSPGLAAAALLRAHELDPTNGGHLVNLAGLAVSLGLPNEALGLLDGAATRTLRTPAVGVSQRAIALTVRGEALLLTGRPAPAGAAFTAAKAAAPLLSEADAGLATVAACAGDLDGAVRGLRDGRQREPAPVTERPDPGLDLSRGRPSRLRVLPIAPTPAAGVRMKSFYDSILDSAGAEITSHAEQATELAVQLGEGDLDRTRAEVRRRTSIVDLATAAHTEPAIATRASAFTDAADRLRVHRERFFGGSQDGTVSTYEKLDAGARLACAGSTVPGCFKNELMARCRPALTSSHATWLTLLNRAQQSGKAYYTALSTRMSAYAANLATPQAHDIVLHDIASRETTVYSRLADEAFWWTLMEEIREQECITPAEVEVPAAPSPADVAAEAGCPDSLKGIDFVFELGPSSFKASCEKVEQELTFPVAPLVEAFVETTYDARAGSVTVFAGGKIGEKVGGVVDAGFKSGIYVSVDTKTGDLTDVGWRVGPKVTAGAAHMELTVANQEMDLSFVAGMQGAFGG